MKQRKLLALGMASVMAMSTTAMALADDVTNSESASGTISGTGSIEGYAEADVFTVTLPTTSSFSFTIDPQELLLKSGSTAQVDSAALTEGYGSSVLFGDETSGFTTTSDNITVVNKSSFDVDVVLTAAVTGLTNDSGTYSIGLVDDSADDFDFGTDTALSLKITSSTNTVTDGTEGTAVASDTTYLTDSASGIKITDTVAVTPNADDAFTVSKDGTTGKYSYSLAADLSAVTFNEVTYNISGTVNTAANWKNFSDDDTAALGIAITYSVAKHVDGPQATMTADGVVTFTGLTADANVNAANVTTSGSTQTATTSLSKNVTWDTANWSQENGGTLVLNLGSTYLSYYAGETVTVTATLSDGSVISCSATFPTV